MTNEYVVKKDAFTFVVPKNHNFKFELLEEQQILDVAIWSKDNPKKEFLSMGHSLWKNGRFISLGSCLWSDYKNRRVIAKCVDETWYESSIEGWYHHLLQGYCDDEENQGRGSCKTNFLNSIKEFGLGVNHLNDNTINLFEKVKVSGGRNLLLSSNSDAKKGDHITFQSYIDLLVSVSLCPTVYNGTETNRVYVGEAELKNPYYHYDFTDKVNPIKISINPNKWPYQVYE
tara:strand:- start:4124 stop:4813 length:690 start_codon:yes stop_codon:yes gene_type:complete